MPAKKLSDYVAELKAAADKDKGFEPLKQVETLSVDLKERSEKRIEKLEADRAAYNAEIDKAIARERANIKKIDAQLGRLKTPDTGAKPPTRPKNATTGEVATTGKVAAKPRAKVSETKTKVVPPSRKK